MKEILKIFTDKKIIKKIKEKLPYLFQLAELDNSRNGKLGMEIGSARERIIIGLLMYKFGEENVSTNVGITESEIDAVVFDEPVSIKTITGKKITGVKLIWTVDPQKALDFSKKYYPSCDMLLVQVNWGNKGYLYFFQKEVQEDVLQRIGRSQYIKLPKQGTNPRGVEISGQAVDELIKHHNTFKVEIDWQRHEIKYNPYEKWIEHWSKD